MYILVHVDTHTHTHIHKKTPNDKKTLREASLPKKKSVFRSEFQAATKTLSS